MAGRRQPHSVRLTLVRTAQSSAWLAAPAFALLGIIFLAPLAWFFVRTLLVDTSSSALIGAIGMMLASRVMLVAIITTFWISALVTASTLIAGYPIAWYLASRRGVHATLIIFAVIVPYFTSLIVRTYAWMVLLGRDGVINNVLRGLGLIDHPLPLLYNKSSIVIGMSYVLLPYMVLTLFATMRTIDPALVRAARGLGAGPVTVFLRVYLPLTRHGIVAGALIVFILSIGFYITPALLGGPPDVMVAMLIERAVEITLDWQSAAIMSLVLLVVTLILYGVYVRVADINRLIGTGE